MNSPRHHTFNGRRYKIIYAAYIGGVTDVPGKPDWTLMLVDGDKIEHLDNALHEGAEAMGFGGLHDKDGNSITMDLARFLWRLGWRRTVGK